MGKPVNLNRFRKKKERAAQKARSDQNAILYGLPKMDKDIARARSALDNIKLTQKQRDDDRTD